MHAFRKTILLGALAACMTSPIVAQGFSEGYEFLKAVRERDGAAATNALNQPGSTIVNTRDLGNGRTALHIVTERRDPTWMRFLTGKGADPNIRDDDGITPLVIASRLSFVEGAEILLVAGADVDETNQAGETPLISAVHQRDMAMIRLLLKHGADPDRTDNSGRSARDYAKLMKSTSLLSEFAKADKERTGNGAGKTYGPKL